MIRKTLPDISKQHTIISDSKCSDGSMEMQIPAFLGKYDRPSDQQTNRLTTDRPTTDRRADREFYLEMAGHL